MKPSPDNFITENAHIVDAYPVEALKVVVFPEQSNHWNVDPETGPP